MITATVNGDVRELPEGTTVSDLVRALAPEPDGRGVAVALGDEVVPRGAWSQTVVLPGARVEVVVAVGGG